MGGYPPPVIRVATYNIRHASLKGLQAVADVLRAIDADVYALQEVDVSVRRSGSVDQARSLAERLDLAFAFGRAMPFEGGDYGVALLTRHELGAVSVLPLPWLEGAEPRTLLRAEVLHPEGRLVVAVTHLGLDPSERMEQAMELRRQLDGGPRTLLLGDFNEGHTEPAFRHLEERFVDCAGEVVELPLRTYPAEHPTIGIDHVFRSADLPRARSALTIETQASDHLPLVVDLG